MKPRLSRPLVTAIVAGALVAGGAVVTSPVQAAVPAAVPAATEEPTTPTGEPTTTAPTTPTGEPTTTAPTTPTGEPTTTAPTTPTGEPTTTAPTTPTGEPTTTGPTTPTGEPTTTAPTNEAPTGSFRLSPTAIWLGQKVTFGQAASEFDDDTTDNSEITRVVDWGDGTTTTLGATEYVFTKLYGRTGTFNVTVTLTDKDGKAATLAPKAVSVTSPAGGYYLNKKSVYQGVPFSVNVTKVPAGTKNILIDWSDGWVGQYAARTGAITDYILFKYVNGKPTSTKISGVRTIRIAFINANGASVWLNAGNINVVKDSWKPKLTVTKPKSANKVSSWKTIKGTVSDQGGGLDEPYVWATVVRATTTGKLYCLTPQKKWKRFTTDYQYGVYCWNKGVRLKVTKGKWSLKLPAGLTKGRIHVEVWTWDTAVNYGYKIREANLTRA
ncbi:hypothetical protein AB0M02_01665 [Actinoplanes sp. NPDC051861]|uniref:PKD domain-containing protein n=1 Tax=Actinoplanes sp. NPDC051861 TaxID=3155170 RepID=UPI00343FD8D6